MLLIKAKPLLTLKTVLRNFKKNIWATGRKKNVAEHHSWFVVLQNNRRDHILSGTVFRSLCSCSVLLLIWSSDTHLETRVMDRLPSALLHQRASVIRWLDGRMRGCNIKGLTKPVSGGKEARNVSPVILKLTMFIWSWPVWHLAYYQCPYGRCFNCQSPSAVPLGRKTWRRSAMLFQGRANVSIALSFLLALL